MKGTVKFYSKEKGFGFIVGDDDIERFVGVREIIGAKLPENGQIVEFESKEGKKGLYAAKVKIISQGNNTSNHRQDDRVPCPKCFKKIYPKLIHNRGFFGNPTPRKSLCPFCGSTVKNFSGCYIATAIYDSYEAPEVYFFRHYRDTKLAKTNYGITLIKIYYLLSPTLARIIGNSKFLSAIVKKVLDKSISNESF